MPIRLPATTSEAVCIPVFFLDNATRKAKMKVSKETIGFNVIRDTMSQIENAIAECPLGMPPLKGFPLLKMALIIITITNIIDITAIIICDSLVFIIISI